MIARAAVGPLMPNAEPLMGAITMPLRMPAINPAKRGAPEAKAMPSDKGIAIKKTAIPAGKSYFKLPNRPLILFKYFIFICIFVIYGTLGKLT
jgi:hypothetical protein